MVFRNPLLLVAVAAVLFACLAAVPRLRAELKPGDPAPRVAGEDEDGRTVNLADVYQRQPYTLVYFYPKAGTRGCTAQGCSLRDAYADLTARGVAVVGVSLDTVEAQKAFKDKNRLPFILLADPGKGVVRAFGVGTLIKVPGLEMAKREAFLIRGGKIVWADYKASTDQQAADVLRVVASLEGAKTEGAKTEGGKAE